MPEIKNVPEYAKAYRFWVYREVDEQRWFWGAFNDMNEALHAAYDIHGFVHDKEEKRNDAV